MPSVSPSQHRWIGWLHSDPAARARSGMSAAKVDEWLHSDKGSPWEHHAEGGRTSYDTPLSKSEEQDFQQWKQRYAPHDTGEDYDLRGAYRAGLQPDPETGHWRDTFKKPNHPTFSDQSQYARFGSPGHWEGDIFVPPAPMNRGGMLARQGGGMMPMPGPGAGGMAPTAANQDPRVQGLMQRYAQMPTEQLQEAASRVPPGSPYGRIIQMALQMRHMQPQAAAPAQAPQQMPAQAPTASPGILPMVQGQLQPQQARGGPIHAFQGGGSMLGLPLGEASPWWERQDERQMASGYLHGSTLGRADHITTTAPGGAYVMPADVISGLGEGNSLAGAHVMQMILASGPYGTSLPRGGGRGRGTIPRPPPLPQNEAKGGGVQGGRENIGKPVDVKLSHGEFVIPPRVVARFGAAILRKHGGKGVSDKHVWKTGHDFFDEFVKHKRRQIASKMLALPGPTR